MNNMWKVFSYIGFAGAAINLALQIQGWSKAGKAPSQADAAAAVDPVLLAFSNSFGVDIPMAKADAALAATVTIFTE
jgi:hypothetical protein